MANFIFENEDLKFGIKDNGKYISVADCVNLLNELNDENTHIKQTIKEAYENERTSLGKSVLKQLLEQME